MNLKSFQGENEIDGGMKSSKRRNSISNAFSSATKTGSHTKCFVLAHVIFVCLLSNFWFIAVKIVVTEC